MHRFKSSVNAALDTVLSKDYALSCKNLELVSAEFKSYLNNSAGLYYCFLFELTKLVEPELVVELGNREGMSTVVLASGLGSDSQMTTVDVKQNLRFVPERIKKDSRIKFLFGDDLSPAITNNFQENSIDILFIDTLHTSEHLEKELELYTPFLKDEALILLDDITMNFKGGNLRDAWQKIKHEKINKPELHNSGFGIVFYSR